MRGCCVSAFGTLYVAILLLLVKNYSVSKTRSADTEPHAECHSTAVRSPVCPGCAMTFTLLNKTFLSTLNGALKEMVAILEMVDILNFLVKHSFFYENVP